MAIRYHVTLHRGDDVRELARVGTLYAAARRARWTLGPSQAVPAVPAGDVAGQSGRGRGAPGGALTVAAGRPSEPLSSLTERQYFVILASSGVQGTR